MTKRHTAKRRLYALRLNITERTRYCRRITSLKSRQEGALCVHATKRNNGVVSTWKNTSAIPSHGPHNQYTLLKYALLLNLGSTSSPWTDPLFSASFPRTNYKIQNLSMEKSTQYNVVLQLSQIPQTRRWISRR